MNWGSIINKYKIEFDKKLAREINHLIKELYDRNKPRKITMKNITDYNPLEKELDYEDEDNSSEEPSVKPNGEPEVKLNQPMTSTFNLKSFGSTKKNDFKVFHNHEPVEYKPQYKKVLNYQFREKFLESLTPEEKKIFNEVKGLPKDLPVDIEFIEFADINEDPIIKQIHRKNADSKEFIQTIKRKIK